VGLGIGVWAVWTMNPFRVSIFPEPKAAGVLVQSGPYKWIRHPMYTAILIIGLATALAMKTSLGWAVYVLLCINQLIKLQFEEKLLMEKYINYSQYMNKTKRIIPFLY
jgi:protein-S-isoprenylcysteine O-methyltransferase Ste14